MLLLEVDGQRVEIPDGTTVLDAVLAAGTYIPHLCQDPDQERIGACRTCLVQIEGARGMPASCCVPAESGMVVRANDPDVERIRKGVLQLTLDRLCEHDASRLGELGVAINHYGIDPGRFLREWPPVKARMLDDSNPIWLLDGGRCILCQRCVHACHEVQHIDAISLLNRSRATDVGFFAHGLISDSNCTNCGQCWATCPTLAIRLRDPLTTRSGKRGDT
jgi:predicted molibdopterin-dependent oxidoreductase YjgC